MSPVDSTNSDSMPDDIAALLGDAIAPEPIDAALVQRVKRRLLRRIAADQAERHLTVQGHQGQWAALGPGLQIKVLHQAGGIMSYLVKLAPGAALPPHRHPVDEECIVLEGELRIGDLRVGAGSFHLGRKDVLHDRVTTVDGALIYLRGATPDTELLI
jgi:anti-sigma factor ChrR (cupin superfamily)